MDEAHLVSRLAELTGLLFPAEGTPLEALDRARRFLAEALLNGQSEPMDDPSSLSSVPTNIDTLPLQTVDDLRRIAHDAIPAQRDRSLRVFRRTWPLLATHISQSVPAWASGWSPELSLGPFESTEDDLVWFDIRCTVSSALVVDSQTERPLISLPSATLSAGPVNVGVTVLNIPAGSVWFAAPLFDSNSPVGSFAGLRIRGGTLTLSHAVFVDGNIIRVSPGIVVTLQLQLDLSQLPPRTRHGGDAHKMSADLPEQVTFTLGVGVSGKLIQVAPATLEVYDNRMRLRHLEGAAPRYDSLLARLCFPLSVSQDAISIDEARSRIFRPLGETPIREASWTLPVALPQGGNAFDLGEAAGAGALALSLVKGLHVTLEPVESSKPLLLDSAFLLAEPGYLSVIANSAPARYRRTLDLWENSSRGRSQIELQSNDPLLLRFDATMASEGAEALIISTLECGTQLDRPVTAAGQRVPFASRRATLGVQQLANVTRIALVAPADPARDPVTDEQTSQFGLSFALSNALVRTSAALTLQVVGVLNEQHQVERGTLILRFAIGFLLPSLPDPYAANTARQAPRHLIDPAFFARGPQIAGRVRWTTSAHAEVSFALGTSGDSLLSQSFLRIDQAPIQHETRRERDYLPEVEARFPRATGQGPELFRLLDVSSRADLFGVGYSTYIPDLRGAAGHPETLLHLRGLDLIAPIHNVSAFTLPAFQWEPIYNIPAEGALPFPPKLVSPTDGGPTHFAIPVANLTSVAPLPVVDALVTEYNRQDNMLLVRFTLPFGIVAVAELRRPSESPLLNFDPPRFGSVRPDFSQSKLRGGLQLTLQAPRRVIQQVGGPAPGLPGSTVQTNNSTSGHNVLKSGLVDEIFNETFADKMKRVPVQRIDFSGYGASTFSDWRHPEVKGAGVTQVKFEALVGRTSREVVQVRSKVYPWGAIFVRIITMERTGSGGVFRRDSGWQAASDGDYNLSGCVVHPGVVPRLTNIRRIRDTTNIYERVYPIGTSANETVKLTQVVFDADVEIEGVTLGANASRRVPTRDIIGYVQVLPVGKDLTAEQLNDLLIATGPTGGPIDCELNVAQSGLHMRLSRIEVDRTTTLAGNPQFVAVARGTAELPSAGQWTFAYRGLSEPEPHRLEADRPIPLIRANPTGGVVPPYRFADPHELHRPTNPDSEYGLLFSAGAQRMLIPQPQVHWGDATIHSGATFLFADMYTLAGGVALFPRPDLCHPLPTGSALRITGRKKVRLEIAVPPGLAPGEFKVGPLERTLSQSAGFRVRSRFRPDSTIKLMIDSDQRPDWSCTFGPVSMLGDIADLDELVQVVGKMSSNSQSSPQFQDPQMVFGGPLAPVQAIIQFLSAFGLPFPFDVSVTNTKYAFKSGWKYVFPKYGFKHLEEALENGAGVMLELELLGRWGKESEVAKEIEKEFAEHSLVSTKGTSRAALRGWHFVVEYNAKVLLEVIKLGILKGFAGGASKFEIGGEEEGKTEISYFLGVAGAVEVELGVLTFTGGRSYTFGFQHLVGAKQIALGGSSEWEIEGEFLKGLAAVKVSFELLTLVLPAEDFEFKGEGTLAIDLTVGWVLSKTYEVEVTIDEHIAAAVFVAAAVLP